MKAIKKSTKYVEWLNAEEMHQGSRIWISDLKFIKDEQHFFDDLIKSYTLQIIDSIHFSKSKEMVEALKKLQKKNKALIKVVIAHENKLQIMVDGIDEPKKEEAYKEKHRELIITISEYFNEYKAFKIKLFELIKNVLKKEKQKYLLK